MSPGKKSIILISPPTATNRTPEECLGIEYLTAESRKNGHSVICLDAWMEQLGLNAVTEKVMSRPFDVVGISPSMDSFQFAADLAHRLKSRGFLGKIVMGGIYASFETDSLIRSCGNDLTGVITGEADRSFQQFLKTENIKTTPGAVYYDNGNVKKIPNELMAIGLSDLPLPSRESVQQVKKWKTPSHVMGSRGCYGNCSFCSVACFQKFSAEKRWRGRSPESIVTELKELSKKGVNMVKFVDDNFFGPGNKSREKKFASLLKKARLNIRFRLSLRVNDVDEEVIHMLKEAGLFAVSMGVESFVKRKLIDYAKGTTIDQNLKAVKILEQNQIYVQMGHIMFDPFTTISEIRQELDGLKAAGWAVTKGICTQLFAAEGTRITETIRKKVGFIGKEGTNNIYQIVDKKARNFHQCLRRWAKANSRLYDKAIDPISAPKNVPLEFHQRFHQICIKLKDLDISVACGLLKTDFSPMALQKKMDNYLSIHRTELDNLAKETDNLYDECGLKYFASTNIRI